MSKSRFTIQELAEVGFTLFMDIYEGRFIFASNIAEGECGTELRLAVYHAKYGRFADPDHMDDALACFQPDISEVVNLIKAKADLHEEGQQAAANATTPALDAMAKLMKEKVREPALITKNRQQHARKAEKKKAEQQRASFNAQHQPAPEGTVKELAEKYGKSLSEIRKLKAANQLHTLVA